MNTEQRILAMLSKIEKVQAVKKENLGAIEDAINEAKSNLSDLYDNMDVLQSDLDRKANEIIDALSSLRNDAESLLSSTGEEFQYNLKLYNEANQELQDLGIEVPLDIDELNRNYENTYDYLNEILGKLQG